MNELKMVARQELVNRRIQTFELESALEAFVIADQGSHIAQLTQRDFAERKRSRMSEVQRILAGEENDVKQDEQAETKEAPFALNLRNIPLSAIKEESASKQNLSEM